MQSIRLESGLGGLTHHISAKLTTKNGKKRNYCRLIMLLAKIFKVSMITITMVSPKNIQMIMIGQIMKTHANHNIIPNRTLLSSIYKSNLALIVKGNDQGNYFAAVTDILSSTQIRHNSNILQFSTANN
jgi:hypothetical protein